MGMGLKDSYCTMHFQEEMKEQFNGVTTVLQPDTEKEEVIGGCLKINILRKQKEQYKLWII